MCYMMFLACYRDADLNLCNPTSKDRKGNGHQGARPRAQGKSVSTTANALMTPPGESSRCLLQLNGGVGF